MEKGLYSSAYEHDACGVGMVVNIHGNKSHELVDNALKVLENMRHRGAEGADNKTGDGAGIRSEVLRVPITRRVMVPVSCSRFHMSLFFFRVSQCQKKVNMVRVSSSCLRMRRNSRIFSLS